MKSYYFTDPELDEQDLYDALIVQQYAPKDEDDSDSIEIYGGTYLENRPDIFKIAKTLEIDGDGIDETKLFAAFIIAEGATLILRDLTLNCKENFNAIACYDGEIILDNVRIHRESNQQFDTIYLKNSSFSFKNSEINTGSLGNNAGMFIENSTGMMENSKTHLLRQEGSSIIIKNCIIDGGIGVLDNSSLMFNELTIYKHVEDFGALYVMNSSKMIGDNLKFEDSNKSVVIQDSEFRINNLETNKELEYEVDNSTFIIDGQEYK